VVRIPPSAATNSRTGPVLVTHSGSLRMTSTPAQHPYARHLANPHFDSLRAGRGGGVSTRSDAATARRWPVSVTVAAMDRRARAPIPHTPAWEGPRGNADSNDESRRSCRQRRDRLCGRRRRSTSAGAGRVRELRRCVSELGFQAVRVLPWLWSCRPRTPLLSVLSDAANRDHVLPQVGHTGRSCRRRWALRSLRRQVAIDFPELAIVAATWATRDWRK